jgi:hypothetical protein
MIRPLTQIAIIALVVMAGILSVQQAQGQAMSAIPRAAGAPADDGKTKAPDKQEAKSASTGSSRWTAGATTFASPDKGAWGGGHSFSSTPKSAWTPSSEAFSQGAVQPSGEWRIRPSFSTAPEGATSTNRTEAESVSAEPATSRGSISGMGHQSGIGSHQSDRGSRQFGVSARHSTTSAHQFGMPLRGKAGKPALGILGQRHSMTPTSFGGSQSRWVSGGKRGTTGHQDRHGALSPGLGQHRLGSGLGGTGSGFDSNSWEPQLHSEQSKPQRTSTNLSSPHFSKEDVRSPEP